MWYPHHPRPSSNRTPRLGAVYSSFLYGSPGTARGWATAPRSRSCDTGSATIRPAYACRRARVTLPRLGVPRGRPQRYTRTDAHAFEQPFPARAIAVAPLLPIVVSAASRALTIRTASVASTVCVVERGRCGIPRTSMIGNGQRAPSLPRRRLGAGLRASRRQQDFAARVGGLPCAAGSRDAELGPLRRSGRHWCGSRAAASVATTTIIDPRPPRSPAGPRGVGHDVVADHACGPDRTPATVSRSRQPWLACTSTAAVAAAVLLRDHPRGGRARP